MTTDTLFSLYSEAAELAETLRLSRDAALHTGRPRRVARLQKLVYAAANRSTRRLVAYQKAYWAI